MRRKRLHVEEVMIPPHDYVYQLTLGDKLG